MEDEIERRAGGFLLAVGMIDQHLVQMGVHLAKPTGVGGRLEV
jgi:hypothetical protein